MKGVIKVNSVEPIRDKRKIEKMKKLLRETGTRDYCMFVLGINSGLRISDLLKLKVKDVMNEDRKLRDRISITEQKTGKAKDFPISESSGKALKEHLTSLKNSEPEGYLFPSRKSSEPITRVQAWRILNDAAGRAGISTSAEPIGTHTLRKTFGYHAYKMGMDLSVIQKLLNHSSPAVTLAYIGITKDDLDKVYLNLNL
jgi:integrase